MSDHVRLRFNAQWYKHHNTSCVEKAVAFGLGAALNMLPFVFAFHARRWFSGRPVVLREALRATAQDTAVTGLVMFTFLGTYCSLNNIFGYASVWTATASGALGCALLGMGRAGSVAQFALAGVVLTPIVWRYTSVLKVMAEEPLAKD